MIARAAAILLLSATAQTAAQEVAPTGPLTVELNKLEAGEAGGCRAFFLFRNDTGLSFDALEMSLAILDGHGVIDRLLTIDAAPVPVARTVLKLFEVSGIGCDAISEMLLHDVPACRPQNAEADIACFAFLELTSRSDVGLVK